MNNREAFEAWWNGLESNYPCYGEENHRNIAENAWQAATAAERERCAKVCDVLWEQHDGSTAYGCHLCAAAIRKGPKP